ncbi:lipoprotein, type 6 [Strigomonas culicis]|uniref:Lipoprotein, type 6 n=1 Tax=Strigomonas culicis TaxID=28005 RepID=S9U407_9TRYP|nr:lipoprotein, type 6 [Strigomonas culicis]|eukprot:EPY23643.1 lipoprotein, type 6 [Strigomonas culicis]
MAVGGAPPRPQNSKFRDEKEKLFEKRKGLIETVKDLQDKIKASKLSREEDPEAEQWKIELDRIDEENAIEKAKRTRKNEEAAAVKAERQELANKAKDTARELKCFSTLQEIDSAIDLLMRRMETSSKGSSASSRQTEKQIRELRRVRPLILVRRGQDEQVERLKEREDNLKQESFEINERIKVLTQQRDIIMKKKQANAGKNREAAEERSALFKQITDLRAQITEVNETIDKLFEENRKANAAYDDWCTEAKARYAKQQEERRREQEEKYHTAKKEEKMNRARLRQNPYKVQIAACDTLAQYLKDRKLMTEREEKQRKMKEEAKHFDPTSNAPEGYVVLNDGKWNNATTASPGKKKKAQRQQQQQQPKKASPATATTSVRLMQHSEDKMKLFQLVGLTPVLSLDAVDASIIELGRKKKELRKRNQER